jgi:hypothetical protein
LNRRNIKNLFSRNTRKLALILVHLSSYWRGQIHSPRSFLFCPKEENIYRRGAEDAERNGGKGTACPCPTVLRVPEVKMNPDLFVQEKWSYDQEREDAKRHSPPGQAVFRKPSLRGKRLVYYSWHRCPFFLNSEELQQHKCHVRSLDGLPT